MFRRSQRWHGLDRYTPSNIYAVLSNSAFLTSSFSRFVLAAAIILAGVLIEVCQTAKAKLFMELFGRFLKDGV